MADEPPDEVEQLPELVIEGEATEETARQVADRAIQLVTTRFSGPLPPPAVLQAYDDMSPGLADRIVAMAEREQEHRHNLEDRAFNEDSKLGKRGQILAFIIAFAGLVAAVILGLTGQPVVAGIIASLDLVTLVTVFLIVPRMGETSSDEES
jgi:uncharacterized membrane protein